MSAYDRRRPRRAGAGRTVSPGQARPATGAATEVGRSRLAAMPDLSLVVGRAMGTVVVTVDGELDLEGAHLLARLLRDLIEGQGNLAVAVDLGKAVVRPEAVAVFVEAARRARDHGTKFLLKKPPLETHEALRAGGVADTVEVVAGHRPDA